MVWRYACALDIILALIFVTFLLCKLCHFLTSDSMKVCRQWVPCERNSSYNFIPIFLKLCICFLHGFEICMWFGYNPWTNFCHFFFFVNFVIFLTSDYMKVYRQWVPCKRSSLYNFIFIFMQLYTSFFHGLKMCMCFEFNPGVNFCHFSILFALSFFKFSQVRHQLHRSVNTCCVTSSKIPNWYRDSSVGKTVCLATYLCRRGSNRACGMLAKISSGEEIYRWKSLRNVWVVWLSLPGSGGFTEYFPGRR